MKQQTRIFLCGLMGSGKSTVGKILAGRLGVPFADLDSMIEQTSGKSIAAIFESDGETRFREMERSVLEEVLGVDDGMSNYVIALGGGALQSRALGSKVSAAGILIYLETSVDVLAARLQGDKTRPLLSMPDEHGEAFHQPETKMDTETNVKATLQRLLQEREPLYRMAAVRVSTDGKTPDEVADACLKELVALGRTNGGIEPNGGEL